MSIASIAACADRDFAKEAKAHQAIAAKLRRENEALQKQLGNWDLLCQQVAAEAALLPRPQPPRAAKTPKSEPREMVCLLSDAHAGESWTLGKTEGRTKYNFGLFCRNLAFYGEELIRQAILLRPAYGLRRLHVDILGDIYHGRLRLDDEVTADFPTVPGVPNTAAVLYQWLVRLAGVFDQVVVTCVAGNHGRLHPKPQQKRYVEENLDTLVYKIAADMIRVSGMADRVQVTIPESRTTIVERLGHRYKLGHGDHIPGGNSIAGVPIFGLSRDVLGKFYQEAMTERRAQRIALLEYGHFHQLFRHKSMLLNGALCPTGPYAYNNHRALEAPRQMAYLISRKYAYGVWLEIDLSAGAKVPHYFTYNKTAALNHEEN